MSKTIDERVVEMWFVNRQFESNVKTTMSTLISATFWSMVVLMIQ